MEESTNSIKKRKMARVLDLLKSKISELESIEKEIKSAEHTKTESPRQAMIVLEQIIVPPLATMKEKEEAKGKNK